MGLLPQARSQRLRLRRRGTQRLHRLLVEPPPAEGRQASWVAPGPRLISSTELLARRLAARWLIQIEGDPIESGAILIGSDGRIQEVGHDANVSRPQG